jgi:hypothetical protein
MVAAKAGKEESGFSGFRNLILIVTAIIGFIMTILIAPLIDDVNLNTSNYLTHVTHDHPRMDDCNAIKLRISRLEQYIFQNGQKP